MFAKSILKLVVLSMAFGLVTGCANFLGGGDKKAHNIVFQVIDNDPVRWKQAMGIARNLKKDMGSENVAIEIVAHGGGVNMVLKESELAEMLASTQKDGVSFAVCAQSMKHSKVAAHDLLQGVNVVPFGAKEIMSKQEAGWTYIRI